MNQILQVHETRKKTNPIDTKKVVLFFAVSIILFGLILLGQGVYSVYKNKENTKVSSEQQVESNEQTYVSIPTITLTKTEDNKLSISVNSELQIANIIYGWNNETTKTIEGNGSTNIEEIIDIPTGQNTFNISVIDSNGNETKKQETYTVEQSKPVIELSVVGNDIKSEKGKGTEVVIRIPTK